MVIAETIIAYFCGMALTLGFPQVQGWHGIRPLHSTRADVEKLIGPPMEPKGITYDTKDERVNVLYSDVPCAKGWPYGWNVPSNTVVSIVTYPKTKRTLSDLQIDLSRYKRNNRPTAESVIYYNDEDGITIEAESNDQIKSIQYLPVSGDSNLRCPASAAREASVEKGESAYVTPDLSYFDVSESEQRVRLDYFADRLKQHMPKSIVYIIGYAGRRVCPDEAQQRASWAKNYLVSKHKIPEARVRILDGGNRDDIWVELFIVSPGGPKPLSSPDIYPTRVRYRSDCGRGHHKRNARDKK